MVRRPIRPETAGEKKGLAGQVVDGDQGAGRRRAAGHTRRERCGQQPPAESPLPGGRGDPQQVDLPQRAGSGPRQEKAVDEAGRLAGQLGQQRLVIRVGQDPADRRQGSRIGRPDGLEQLLQGGRIPAGGPANGKI